MDKQTKRAACEKFRAVIRTQLTEAEPLVRAIRTSTGMTKDLAWREKRREGEYTRAVLLGYAFLRGVPYRVLENRTAPDKRPSYRYIAIVASEIMGMHVSEDAVLQWTLGEVPSVQNFMTDHKDILYVPSVAPTTTWYQSGAAFVSRVFAWLSEV